MDTVYLAVEVFRLKIPSELGTEQKYAPSFIVAISQTKLNSIKFSYPGQKTNPEVFGEKEIVTRHAQLPSHRLRTLSRLTIFG